jgi:hypothetical protein
MHCMFRRMQRNIDARGPCAETVGMRVMLSQWQSVTHVEPAAHVQRRRSTSKGCSSPGEPSVEYMFGINSPVAAARACMAASNTRVLLLHLQHTSGGWRSVMVLLQEQNKVFSQNVTCMDHRDGNITRMPVLETLTLDYMLRWRRGALAGTGAATHSRGLSTCLSSQLWPSFSRATCKCQTPL